jgi:hypothetical protein
MSKKKNKSKIPEILNERAPFLFAAILAFVIFMADLVFFEDHVKSGWVLGISKKADERVVPGQAKKLENTSPKNIKAKSHVESVKKVVSTLEGVSDEEEALGNEEVSEEITKALEEIEDSAVEAAEDIEEIESRPDWKKFILGSDYKNLGQLRSNLVRTENGIRKVNRTMERVEGSENDEAIQEQLGELEQERERIMNFIQQEEESFSLLGWVVRLFSGYSSEETEVPTDSMEITETELLD